MSRNEHFRPATLAASRGSVTEVFDQKTDPWLEALLVGCADQNVDPTLIELSWSFAHLEPDLDQDIRYALCLVSLLCLQGRREGNVRIPVGADGYAYIDRQLTAWKMEDQRPGICRLIDDRKCPSLLAGPSDHSPVIATDGWLYSHRTYHQARSLERHLAERLQAPNTTWPKTWLSTERAAG